MFVLFRPRRRRGKSRRAVAEAQNSATARNYIISARTAVCALRGVAGRSPVFGTSVQERGPRYRAILRFLCQPDYQRLRDEIERRTSEVASTLEVLRVRLNLATADL